MTLIDNFEYSNKPQISCEQELQGHLLALRYFLNP